MIITHFYLLLSSRSQDLHDSSEEQERYEKVQHVSASICG